MLPSTGTGVGGSVGGPHTPLPRDVETTAWTEVNKAALNITPDSIQQVFTEINPRFHFGYLGGFGYRATPGQALLDHPLETVRVLTRFAEIPDDSSRPQYDALVNQLPADLLQRFLRDRQLPFEQRNSSFVALDQLLMTVAQLTTRLETVAQPAAPDSMEATRTTLNFLLPFAALKGAISNSSEIAQSAHDFLAAEGANYTYFDGFNNALNQMEKALGLLQQVNNGLDDTPGGQLNAPTKAAATKAAAQLETLTGNLDRISLGSDLQILKSTLNAMEIIATALSLPNTASASLYIGLSTAMIGIEDNEMGLIGSNLALVLDTLTQGISAGIMPGNSPAGNKLFSLLVAGSLLAFISLAAQAADPGLGILPHRDPQTDAAAHAFAFEIAVMLTANSGFVQELYKGIIAASGGDAHAQETGSAMLAQVALLAMILSGALTGRRSPEGVLEGNTSYLSQGIAVGDEISGASDSETAVATSVALKQAAIAIDNHDVNGLMEALGSLLESLGTSKDDFQKDVASIGKTIGTLVNMAGKINEDEPLTGTVNVV